MNTAITKYHPASIEAADHQRRAAVGQMANDYHAAGAFADYLAQRPPHTVRRHRADLALFARYLVDVQFYAPGDAAERTQYLQTDPTGWAQITYGLIGGFVKWQLQQGYAIGSINVRLATVRQYAKLAFQAGALPDAEYRLIQTVKGYRRKAGAELDKRRIDTGTPTRRSAKKAEAVTLSSADRRALKDHPDTPQGRRDALLMCLLLDHGLRVGELALLDVTAIDLGHRTVAFYRPKVDKVQTHELSRDTYRAARAYFEHGDAPAVGRLLRKSAKSKDGDKLVAPGMSERAITKRVEYLGRRIGKAGLSAHDCRHSAATEAARQKTPLNRLVEMFGWNSPAMALTYIQRATIANEGVDLSDGD